MNLQQTRNIVTYYLLQLLQTESIPNHITRDVMEFNQWRGEYCGKLYSTYNVLKYIHESENIIQINSVPCPSTCCIDDKPIHTSTAGIQLIIYMKDTIKHLIIQKKYQSVCYNYFKVRYFPELCKQKIQKWFLNESWFFPKVFKSNVLLKSILQSNFCESILTEIQQLN